MMSGKLLWIADGLSAEELLIVFREQLVVSMKFCLGSGDSVKSSWEEKSSQYIPFVRMCAWEIDLEKTESEM